MKRYFIKQNAIGLALALITFNLFSQTFTEQTDIILQGVSSSSVAWGDYDNDGDLDILITGATGSSTYMSEIFRNDAGVFTDINAGLQGVSFGSCAWGDYDNDGDIDILLTGQYYIRTTRYVISRIYRNDNGAFTNSGISLTGIYNGKVAWGDYDNDGDLDILLTGYTGSASVTRIYRNDGISFSSVDPGLSTAPNTYAGWGDYDNDGDLDIVLMGSSKAAFTKIYRNDDGVFSDINAGLPSTFPEMGTALWGDYDNDGDLDLLITGNSGGYFTKIYANSDGIFADAGVSLPGVGQNSAAWGDFDNDGDLDILLSGTSASGNISEVFRNDGNTFTGIDAGLTEVTNNSVAWGDYNNDGALDILLTGNTGTEYVSEIYENGVGTINTKPSSPANLEVEIIENTVSFKWDKASDNETLPDGLNYNLYVYESGSSTYKRPPHALPQNNTHNGKRLIAESGKIQWDPSGFIIKNLAYDVTYQWSVQAVDAGFLGSEFSEEENFIIPVYKPSIQASNISFTEINIIQAKAIWNKGNGSSRVVFIKEGKTGSADPVDNITYSINDMTPGGWKCVYNGTGNSVTITGLSPGIYYSVNVCEYNGPSNYEKYCTETATGNPNILTTLISDPGITLAGVYDGSISWGDYDNDNYLDVLLTGDHYEAGEYSPISRIYKNEGAGTFTDINAGLIGVCYSTAVWGDYDSDGDLDILLTGTNYVEDLYIDGVEVSIIYRNDGGTFTDINAGLPGLAESSAAWGDYDNDGDLDILLAGVYNYGYTGISETKIYKNDNGIFTDISAGLPGIRSGSVSWGDFDNDNDLDLLLTGNKISGIYRNDAGIFTDINAGLAGISECSSAWGDYDNDGDLDILMAGKHYINFYTSVNISKIYNNVDGSFTDIGADLIGTYDGIVGWGDYDDDGDLDIFITGQTSTITVSKIYNNDNGTFTDSYIPLSGISRSPAAWGDHDNDGDLDIYLGGILNNNCNVANYPPDQVLNLAYEIQNQIVTLNWDKVETDETSLNSISYNIRIGSLSGSSNLVPSHSAQEGYRKIVGMGNAQLGSSYLIKKLRWDVVYYASVQAIDNSYQGGIFSNEVNFSISPIQSSNLTAIHKSNTSLLLKWIRGDGDNCIVFVKEGTSEEAIPQDGITYYYNPVFGQGSPIGTTGWYCIYKGEADSVLLTGLNSQKNYTVHVMECQGESGSEVYARINNSNNIGVFSPALFSEQTEISLEGVTNASVEWGDYDNDGYLDICMTGETVLENHVSKIYHNDSGVFSDIGANLDNYVYDGTVSWGDYDNDGALDLLLSCRLYKNYTGAFVYIDYIFQGIDNVSVDWGDYDNDNDLDILISGGNGSEIYRNDEGSFVDINAGLAQSYFKGGVAWGDYDNDGDLDIFLSGEDIYGTRFSKIYRNESGIFYDINAGFDERYYSAVWIDYDNDDDLDLSVGNDIFNNENGIFSNINAGFSGSLAVWGDINNDGFLDAFLTNSSKIYLNNGNNTFSELNSVLLPELNSSSAAFGDYDNDGDLDILITGKVGIYVISKIYRNNLIMEPGDIIPNTKPVAPEELFSTPQPNEMKLTWSSVKNDETTYKTMSYNVRIGSSFGRSDITPSHADSLNGFRRIASMGNAQLDTSYIIRNLPGGKYYWSVQAIDQGYLGGAWSAVDSFEVKNVQTFFSSDIVCQGFPTHFTDQSVATEGIASWLWDFNDGETSSDQDPSYTYATSGIYNVKLVITDDSGAKDSLIQTVTVKAKPVTDFSAPDVCQGTAAAITNTTEKNGLIISSWYWDFGDGQNSLLEQPADHGYLGAADYTVVLKALADNGCRDSITKTVTVASYPVAAVTANAPLTFCKGDSVTLSVPYNNEYLYTWKLNNTAVSGADSCRFVAKLTGSYTAEVVNSKGICKTTSSATAITANDAPSPSFILTTGGTTLCQGDSVVLSVTNTAGYSYQWRLNGGSVGADSNIYIARSSGLYDLILANSTGCKATSVSPVPVVVNPLPTLSIISVKGNEKFCSGESATLSVPANTAYSYNWRRGTNLLDITTNSIVASEPGDYTVDISLAGCSVTAEPVTIEVIQKPSKPDIDKGSYTPEMCLGEKPLILSVDNIVPGYSYQWYKNETPVSKSEAIEVTEAGNYYLEAVTDICNSERDTAIISFAPAPPKPEIIVKGPTVWFLSTTSKASRFKWYFNGSSIADATGSSYVAGQNFGLYRLAVSDESGCYSFSDTVRIPLGITGIDDADPFEDVKIYPNPTTGTFTIEMNNNIFGELVIDIFAQNGSKILNIKFEKTTEHFQSQIDLSGQSKGMYLINLAIDKFRAVRKVLVE